MRKAAGMLLVLCLVAVGTASALAASAAGWTELPEAKDVAWYKTWVVDLPAGVTQDQVEGVTVADESGEAGYVPVYVNWSSGRLVVSPVEAYRPANSYSLRILLSDGRRLRKSFTTELYPTLDPRSPQIVQVPACPDKGFNYSYFLYVPARVDRNAKHRLLVEPNNTGVSSDPSVHVAGARDLIERFDLCRQLADDLRVPLLVPTFPRPGSVYTHSLTRSALLVGEHDPLHRVDLQLVAMIGHARQLLSHNGVLTKDKVFLNGTSASGHFVNRFALLHPETVRAVSSGCINAIVTFPTATYAGENLRFPAGIADLKALTGAEFDLDEYRKVAQLVYWGDQDTNDTVPFEDCYAAEDRDLVWSICGRSLPDRWAKTQDICREAGISAQFVTYGGVGHWPGSYLDILNFFRANDNDGEGITPIVSGGPAGH